MSFYFLAALKKNDAERFAEYQIKTRDIVSALDVELLAVTENFEVLEGELEATNLVLLRFPDEAEFRKYWDDPAYRAVVPLREQSAVTNFALTF